MIDLESAIAKKINVRTIAGTNRSPFGIAVVSGNSKVAMRILHHLGGEADLSNCDLTEIPDSVIRMAQANLISKLDLSNNKLNVIPYEFISIKNLIITGNPLLAVPAEYRDKWVNYKKYLESIQQIDDGKRIKVIVLGGDNTGKTSIVRVSITLFCLSFFFLLFFILPSLPFLHFLPFFLSHAFHSSFPSLPSLPFLLCLPFLPHAFHSSFSSFLFLPHWFSSYSFPSFLLFLSP